MAINPDFRLKVRHFFRDHYKPIFIVVIILVIFAIINRVLMKRKDTRRNTNNIYT